MLTIVVMIAYAIVMIISGLILGYIVFEYFVAKAEFDANPVDKVFMDNFRKAKKERLQKTATK